MRSFIFVLFFTKRQHMCSIRLQRKLSNGDKRYLSEMLFYWHYQLRIKVDGFLYFYNLASKCVKMYTSGMNKIISKNWYFGQWYRLACLSFFVDDSKKSGDLSNCEKTIYVSFVHNFVIIEYFSPNEPHSFWFFLKRKEI